MLHKTNGTNEKVVPQESISAQKKNTFLSYTPSKLGKTPFFRGFLLFKHVYNILANVARNSSTSFCRLDFC